jgi:hypothetical protein
MKCFCEISDDCLLERLIGLARGPAQVLFGRFEKTRRIEPVLQYRPYRKLLSDSVSHVLYGPPLDSHCSKIPVR